MMFGTLTRIVSGGQTGADRGALNAARALSLPIGGWAPQGWRAEDGSIPVELRLFMRESVSPNYGLRTRLNVQDSDGTLILSFANTLTGGSKFTVDQVKAQRKPCKHLVLPRGSGVVTGEVTAALWDWIEENRIAVLNVAGPRESKERGIQEAVERVIRGLLEAKHRSTIMAAMAFGDANADAQATAQKKLYPESMADHVFASAKHRERKRLENLLDSAIDATMLEFGVTPTPQDGSQVAPKLFKSEGDLDAADAEQVIRCFITDCASATTAEDFNRDNTGLTDRYCAMDGNGAGGSLHIVLGDGNYERSSVEFCRDYATKNGDKAGEALARALLALPDDVYDVVLPGPTYCGTCCQDYDEAGDCKCVLHPVQSEGGTDA